MTLNPRAHRLSLVLGLAMALSACATSEPGLPAATNPAQVNSADQQIARVATTPLTDLNVVKIEIPVALQDALHAPYAMPAGLSCEVLARDIGLLDEALGPDLDAPHNPANPSVLERGAGQVGQAALGAVRGAVEGAIPFRGWLRKLSGAERQSAKVAAAIAAGSIRRGYLKGLGQGLACQAPAAPLPPGR